MLKRRCFQAVLALLLSLSAYTYALAVEDWNFLSPSPTGNFIYNSWSPDNGETIYFVGDGGLILRKVGDSYTVMESGTTVPLRGIHGTSATDIWAVGGSSMAEIPAERSVILHFDGTSWINRGMLTLYSTPELSSTYEAYGVYAADTSNVWVVGQYSDPWRWTGGTSWEQEDVTIDYDTFPDYQWTGFNAIFGFSANDVYAVGPWGTVLHKDASGWFVQRQFETEPPEWNYTGICFNLLQDVWGPDADHVFTCGNSGQVYLLDKTQASPAWIQINKGGFIFTAYDLSRMAGSGPDDVWFVGSGGVLRRWHGAGTPEGLDIYDTQDSIQRSSILRIQGSTYYLAGANGAIQSFNSDTRAITQLNTPAKTRSTLQFAGWNGKLWLAPTTTDETTGVFTWAENTLTSHPITGLVSGTVTAFAVFSPTDVWVATSDVSSAGVKRFDGTNWTDWAPTGYYGQDISGIAKSPASAYAVLTGRYWVQGSGSSGSGLPNIVGEDGFYSLDYEKQESYYYNAITSDEDGKFYAVGSHVEEKTTGAGDWHITGGRVVTGQGTTWGLPVDIGQDELRGVAVGDGYVVVVGENRSAYYSLNGGAWTPVQGITRRPPPDDTRPAETFVSVVYAGDGIFYAICNSSGVWTDGGKSYLWLIQDGKGTLVSGGYSGPLYGLAVVPEQNGVIATGFSGSILANFSPVFESGDSIAGRVTDLQTGLGISNLVVQAWTACGGQSIASSSTDSDGYYTITGLPSGTPFYLRTSDGAPGSGFSSIYLHEWYNNIVITDACNATPVNAGSTDIDFQLEPNMDIDDDKMTDYWEVTYFGDTTRDGTGDYDSDGLSDLAEFQKGSNPVKSDTDGDGLSDGNEVNTYKTDPVVLDTDQDGMPDGWEINNNLNPLVNDASLDPDNDRYSNLKEYRNQTDPNVFSNFNPNKPGLLAPADGATGVSLTTTLETESFSDPDPYDTHSQTRWQISEDTGFSLPILDVIDTSSLTSLPVPDLALTGGTTYYWRAMTYDNHSNTSEWADAYYFTTITTTNDQNSNGIPDDKENDTADLDGDLTPDIQQTDIIKTMDTVVGEGQMGVSWKDESLDTSIDSIDSIDPDAISMLARPGSMTFGMFAFRLTVASAGDIANVTVYFSNPAPANARWYKYNPIDRWSDYSELGYATFSPERNYVVLQLKDGDYGDADGIANGVIVDPGGFGVASWLEGYVTDSSTGQGIARAEVSIGDLILETGEDGYYSTAILPGTYSVTASAGGYDALNYPAVVISEGATTIQDFDMSLGGEFIELTSGWNLISMERQPSNANVSAILDPITDKVISVWAYLYGGWQVYDPANPDFSDLSKIEAGKGYWINMDEGESLSISGLTPSKSIAISSGWNLVGYNSSISQDIAAALSSIAGKYISVWAYMGGGWKVYDPANPDFSDLISIEPGYGYWINANQDCTWTIP